MGGFTELVKCFRDIEDPRIERTRVHDLNDILVLWKSKVRS